MLFPFSRRVPMAFCVACVLGLVAREAMAANDFYAGRQIRLTVGSGAGSGGDLYSRFLAAHWADHIPGHPVFVIVNMNGADSIEAGNYINNRAPQDGTEIFNFAQALPMIQAFGDGNIKFDLAAFRMIGNMSDSANVFFTWHTTSVATIADARKKSLTIASATAKSISGLSTIALNNLLGTRFQVINGYQSGEAMNMAVERGEVDGRGSVTWAALKNAHQDWIRDHKINVLVQFGLAHDKELPSVPLLSELVSNDDDLAVAEFLDSLSIVSRGFAVGPKVPGDRVEILRRSFMATLQDPAVLRQTGQGQFDISPMDGAALQEAIDGMVHADPKVIERVKASFKE